MTDFLYSKNCYKELIEKFATEATLSVHDTRINKIKDSGNNNRIIELSYKDSKGNKTKRLVEPYNITPDDFWGFDISKQGIRRFKLKNIKGVKTSSNTFEPRWTIDMN